MNSQQVPALEPRQTEPRHPLPDPPKSPTAIRGATSAFLPKANIPVVSVSPVSASARVAAFAAGTRARSSNNPTPPERYDGRKEPSPPRGRQLHSDARMGLRTGGGTILKSASSQPLRPLLQPRSSSTIAAQHAAAHSRSPHRSPVGKPSSSVTSIGSQQRKHGSLQSTDALSGATASVSAYTKRDPIQVEPTLSGNDRKLTFERSSSPPVLEVKPIRINVLEHGTPQPERHQTMGARGQGLGRSLPDLLTNDQTPAYTATQLGLPRPPLSRGSSAESTTTTVTVASVDINSARTPLQRERPPVPSRINIAQMPAQVKAPLQTKHHDVRKNSLTVNELADAMVASSLASSRANSPSKKNPITASRRRSRSFPASFEKFSPSVTERRQKSTRTPRPMKQTLRKQASSDEEVELVKRGRRHWMRKHPNMHSEGTRKRWRDKVTERERRRYEGVFAANRGLLIGTGVFEPTPSTLSDNLAEGNQVVNMIVRDIWERSRLPREVLKEVYDLVCPEEAHILNREQFVVGLWLIDQRLKGRKLPVTVSPSVWASVRHSQGLKVKRRFG